MGGGAEARWVVCKFGGTSVSTRKTWSVIVAHVRKLRAQGRRVCVIVSAVTQVTNYLEKVVEGLKHETAVANGKGGGAQEETAARAVTDAAVEWIFARHVQHCKDLDVELSVVQPFLDDLRRLVEGIRLTGDSASNRLRARMLTFGELMSSYIGHKVLQREVGGGAEVGLIDARQILVTTSRDSGDGKATNDADKYLNADVAPFALDLEHAAAAKAEGRAAPSADDGGAAGGSLSSGAGGLDARAWQFLSHDVVISQGFIASTPEGQPCVLGRGGSDTSGSLFGAALSAERVEIWTDVDGMFTSDPRHVPHARLIEELSYREAQELAAMGAKVLHPRCLGPAAWAGIPVQVHNTMNVSDKLTRIVAPEALAAGSESRVMAIAKRTGQVLITISTVDMWGTSGFLSRVFAPFERLDISVDLIATSQYAVSMTLDYIPDGIKGEPFRNLIRALQRQGNVQVELDCCVVSVVGRKLRSVLHGMADAFRELERYNLLLLSESTEDLNMSFVLGKSNFSIDALVLNLHSVLLEKGGEGGKGGAAAGASAAEPDVVSPGGRKPRGHSFGAPAPVAAPALAQAVQTLSVARASLLNASSWVHEELKKYEAVPTPFAVVDLATLQQRAAQLAVYPMTWSAQPAVLRSVRAANPNIVFVCRTRAQVLELCSVVGPNPKVFLQMQSAGAAGPLALALPPSVQLVQAKPSDEDVHKANALLGDARVVVASAVETVGDSLVLDAWFQPKQGHRVTMLNDLPANIKDIKALALHDDVLETLLLVEEGKANLQIVQGGRIVLSGVPSAPFSTKTQQPLEQYIRYEE